MNKDRETITADRAHLHSVNEATRLYYAGKISREEFIAARDRYWQMVDEAGRHLYRVSQTQQRAEYRRSFWRGVRSLFGCRP